MHKKPITRRFAMAAGLGLAGAVGLAATAARAQSAKADPSTVGYQLKPNNGQQCSTCSQFVAPAACAIVSGTIAPAAWCELYSPKS